MKYIALAGSERHFLRGSTIVGRSNPHEYIELTIKIRGKQPIPEVNGRPENIRSRDDISKQFGSAPADIKTVSGILGGLGLDCYGSNTAARSLYMGGNVKTMEEVFGVKLMHYSHESGDYRGRIGSVHIPLSLKDLVTGVFGLDSRKMINRKRPPVLRSSLTISSAVQRAWYFPEEVAEKYDFPKSDGKGQVIGILEFGGGYFEDDLKTFCKIAKTPVPKVIPISVDHASTSLKNEDAVEVMMDVEIVANICPAATIPVYFGHFTERGWINILDAAIHDKDNNPSVLSISYGLPEGKLVWTEAAMAAINDVFKQAALLGVTICVSSGDDGSDAQVGDGYAHVSFPSSSPYVLTVGGTNLAGAKGNPRETAWKDGDGLRKDGGGASGGGVSFFFQKPAWQKAVKIPSVDPGAIDGRLVPDVAAHAETDGNTTGYFIVVEGQSARNGGTSAAAPLWASLIGRINTLLPDGKKAGYLTPLLYGPVKNGAASLGTTGCNDITSGDNVSASIGGYFAAKGYDAVTGWGSPDGKKLLAALKPLI